MFQVTTESGSFQPASGYRIDVTLFHHARCTVVGNAGNVQFSTRRGRSIGMSPSPCRRLAFRRYVPYTGRAGAARPCFCEGGSGEVFRRAARGLHFRECAQVEGARPIRRDRQVLVPTFCKRRRGQAQRAPPLVDYRISGAPRYRRRRAGRASGQSPMP